MKQANPFYTTLVRTTTIEPILIIESWCNGLERALQRILKSHYAFEKQKGGCPQRSVVAISMNDAPETYGSSAVSVGQN